MKKVAFHTLGCKVNQVETEQIKEEFMGRGYEIVSFDEPADIYIINTCTVTHVSDRKSRAMVRRAVRKNPTAIVAAIGCTAQVNPEQLRQLEGINLIVGNREKDRIVDIIEDYETDFSNKIISEPITPDDKLKPVIYTQKHQRTRAFVKIQDGCQSFCTYCIVPYARGPVRSKLPQDVLHEVNQLISLGYKEIVFTGIHTGMYGIDIEGWDLVRLLHFVLDKVSGDYRIRLSSIEPLEVGNDLISLISDDKRLCRHLHIPLQSGSDRILKVMNRRYTRRYYRDLVMGIADKIPDMAFTADVMVGFPLEEDRDFRDTFELLKDLPVYDLHVFKYSKRPGTKAAKLTSVVTEEEKNKRSEELLNLAEIKHNSFMLRFIGQEITLLVERKSGINTYIGLSDNYLEVEFEHNRDLAGNFIEVKLDCVRNGVARGSIIHD